MITCTGQTNYGMAAVGDGRATASSNDPDGHALAKSWFVYREAGTFEGEVNLLATRGERTSLAAPAVKQPATVQVILQLIDQGTPALTAYRRAIIQVKP